MASISGRENQPTFERLWHDCIEEEGRTSGKVVKEDNLALATKTRNSRNLSPSKRRERNLRVSFLTCQKWNVIVATSLDILLETAGRTRRNPREGFKHLLQKQRKKKMKNQRRRRKPRLTKLKNLKESTT